MERFGLFSKCYCIHLEVWVIPKGISLDVEVWVIPKVLLHSCGGLGYSQRVSLDSSLGFSGLEVLLRSCRGLGYSQGGVTRYQFRV